MTETLYVCPNCGKSEWLPKAYIEETIDATLCFCQSGYERNTTQMIEISDRDGAYITILRCADE